MKKRSVLTGLVMIIITITIVILVNNRHRPGPYETFGWTYRTEHGAIIIETPNYREYGNDKQSEIRRLLDGIIWDVTGAPPPICGIMIELPPPPSIDYRYRSKAYTFDPFFYAEAY